MNEKEVRELLEEFNVSRAQLPRIFLSDPALPDGCKPGDVIKIEREDSETGETSAYYRVVI